MEIASEDLVRALDGYEPIDLVLDVASNIEIAPLIEPKVPDASTVVRGALDVSLDTDPPEKIPRTRQVKAKIVFLRAQVAELEQELAALSKGRFLATPVWKETAARQRARRTRAEAQNACLRARLRRLIQVAKSLGDVLEHRSSLQRSSQASKSSTVEDCSWEIDLGEVFRRFSLDIHRAYASLDVIFPPHCQPLDPSKRVANATVVKSHFVNSVEQLYVETRQSFIVPFSFHSVSAVGWRAFKTQFETQHRLLELYFSTEEVFACKVTRTSSNAPESQDVVMAATFLAKKFKRGDQTAVVWRGFIAPEHATLREAVAVTTGWLTLQPFQELTNRSICRACIRTIPKRMDLLSLSQHNLVRLPAQHDGLGVFVSQKLCTLAEDLMMVIEEIESILLEQHVDEATVN